MTQHSVAAEARNLIWQKYQVSVNILSQKQLDSVSVSHRFETATGGKILVSPVVFDQCQMWCYTFTFTRVFYRNTLNKSGHRPRRIRDDDDGDAWCFRATCCDRLRSDAVWWTLCTAVASRPTVTGISSRQCSSTRHYGHVTSLATAAVTDGAPPVKAVDVIALRAHFYNGPRDNGRD